MRKKYWFIFYKNLLLLQKKGGQLSIPLAEQPPVQIDRSFELLDLKGLSCMAASMSHVKEETEEFVQMDLRSSWDVLDEEFYTLASKAFQMLYWDENSQYCPVCGTKTIQIAVNAKQCPSCKKELYPTISTAILALVRKEDSILLVRAHSFTGSFHGLVAGFLEVGETLEECVAREVKEETGLTINNITYFDNQFWPYPSGLMVGFIADYVEGEIILQEEELSSGAFYTKENLPELPRKLSLARRMIDWWLETQQT